MADVSRAFDEGPSFGREANELAGLGRLSRFLGAIFLVLLSGLLLLDRALLRANHHQADLDAESAALLTEAFVGAQRDLLDRIADMIARDSIVGTNTKMTIGQLITGKKSVQNMWLRGANDTLLIDIGSQNSDTAIQRLPSPQSGNGLGIIVAPTGLRHAHIILSQPSSKGTIGLTIDGNALRDWLNRTKSGTRRTLVVLSGTDTVAFLGQPGGSAQALAESQKIVRLPTGGTWRITATHALTTRTLRWALWALGVLGALFLAMGLLREQRRSQQAAGRSVELERLYSDVKRANQAKSEFLANVSHELRTPLNAIVGFVELLRDGFYGDLSPRQIPPVDRIAASATHLRHLVDQVLDIAKIAAGRLEVHSETIVLRPFVLNIASELESLVSEKELAFSISVGASLPRVRTDPTHLRQILINLIGNAVKYTPAGTVSVRARLIRVPVSSSTRRSTDVDAEGNTLVNRSPRSGTWVALQVVDTGVGIAAHDFERIFDEFEQVNAGPRGDSMQRGTGLGLAISRRLARLLGGEIGVDSEIGQGSTFTVWLPVAPADLTREPTEAVVPESDTPIA